MLLAKQLRGAGVPCFPCRADKSPAVNAGEDWRGVALQPVESRVWPSGLAGVPVPPRVVIVDLDTYKGVTRAAVEARTGPVPWDAAMIQTTGRGGQHYAFREPAWPVRQGSDLGGIAGLDTRTAGKGFICTGEGYTPAGAGVYRLAAPEALPVLPDGFRPLLEHITAAPPPPGAHDTDPDTVRDALRHIDPECSRAEWLRVCMALRAGFPDDEATAYQLAEEWSAGDLRPGGGVPHNYVPDGPGSVAQQLPSLKPDGGTQLGTLFYMAIQAGWSPPARSMVDTAAAFGAGAGADAEAFGALVDRIQAEGGSPHHTDKLARAIMALPCNDLQRATLSALLQRELRDAGLGTKRLREATEPPRQSGHEYGPNHTVNARLFLHQHYPDGQLVRAQETYYRYNGKVWRPMDDRSLAAQVAHAMAVSAPQSSTVTGTTAMVGMFVHTDAEPPRASIPGRVIFENGVLDLVTGILSPHSPEYRCTCLLPYDYNPAAACPVWRGFLQGAFSYDVERMSLLQQWFGYILAGGYEFQKILLLIGAPRSGKGTIGRVLAAMIGEDNFSGGSLKSVMVESVLDMLRHKRVLFIGDAQKSVPHSVRDAVVENLKMISGNDSLSFDRKYKGAITTTLPTRITIAANGLPRLFDDSGALASRIMPLPIDGSHLGSEDGELFDKLAGELEGIAAWALEGWRMLLSAGRFVEPEASAGDSQYMRDMYSPLSGFIDECIEVEAGSRATSLEVYTTYLKWAQAHGDDSRMGRKVVTSAVQDGLRGRNVRYGILPPAPGQPPARVFDGIRLKQPTSEAFAPGAEVVPIGGRKG